LIDTPGFDDTYKSDTDILKDLAYYLAKSYGNGYRLTGIIYLHPITHNRLTGSAFKNLRTFRKLCGKQSMSSTVLATTMWGDISPADGAARELELKETAEFWGDMVREGSAVYRHTNDHNSAMNIISHLIDRNTTTVLGLQVEMVDENKSLEDTEAGREVDNEMRMEREVFLRRLQDTKRELQEAIEEKDQEHIEQIVREQEKFEAKLDAIQKGREDLRISMEKLIAEKEERHKEELAKVEEQLNASREETKKQLEEYQKFKEFVEARREQDEATKRRVEEELEVAKESKRDADIATFLLASYAMENEQKLAQKSEEEEKAKMEARIKATRDEESRQIKLRTQMAYDQASLEQAQLRRQQFAQEQEQLARMQQASNYYPQPPPYQERPSYPPNNSYQQPYYPPQYGGDGGNSAVGTGMGLATGVGLAGAAMLAGCSVM
jgi:myosin heavy subunit